MRATIQTQPLAVLGSEALAFLFFDIPLALAGEDVLRMGEAEGHPGEEIRLPVELSHAGPVSGMTLSWIYDPEILDSLPPGEAQRIVWIRFRVRLDATPSESPVRWPEDSRWPGVPAAGVEIYDSPYGESTTMPPPRGEDGRVRILPPLDGDIPEGEDEEPVVDPPVIETEPGPGGAIEGEWTIRVGEASARPGERGVRVPVYVTNLKRLQATGLGLPLTIAGIDAAGITIEGSALESFGVDAIWGGPRPEGIVVAILHDGFPPVGATLLPPGIETSVCHLVFDISPSAPEGMVIPIALGEVDGPPVQDNSLVAVDPSWPEIPGSEIVLPILIPGRIVVGDPNVGRATAATIRGDEAFRRGDADGNAHVDVRDADPTPIDGLTCDEYDCR